MELAGASMLASKIAAAVTMAKAGGAASGAILAGLSSQGLALLSQAAAPTVSTLGPMVGALEIGTIVSGCPAAALTVGTVGAKIAVVAAGGAVAVGAVPVVLGAMGFTGAGIAASSLGAKMMSVAAIANGGGISAGSLVATLQSMGAGGLSLASKALVGSVGSAITALAVI